MPVSLVCVIGRQMGLTSIFAVHSMLDAACGARYGNLTKCVHPIYLIMHPRLEPEESGAAQDPVPKVVPMHGVF